MAGNRALAWAGATAAVGGGVGLALPSAHYLPANLPLGGAEPDLDLGLRLVCAGALALAFALAVLTLRQRRAEPLAFASLTGIAVAGILVHYLVITIPGTNRLAPSAVVQPAAGAWVLLASGLVLAATGFAAAANVQRAR
ncbi:hypothetical protein [Amycolatopsis sp. WGS_07]|uniref:hypothetical protein n=1 Tax=Amycolatopsis sp. WGS_07 TaxID=3076764 RepID=UPI0038735985